MHPFPSLLDAAAVAAFAIFAGGRPAVAVGLAAAMVLLQASIGAVNDVVDAAADAMAKPAKPIPAGLVRPRTALAVAITAAIGGLLLAAAFGPGAFLVAMGGYGLGLVYDLRLKRTRWSWLPYALALPLVPVFAWLGAGAGLPPRLPALALMAVLAGLALALANGLVDLEGDALTASAGLAGALGHRRSWSLIIACQAGLALLAVATASGPPRTSAAWFSLGAGVLMMAAGTVLSGAVDAGRRRAGWEGQAIGVGLVAVGWLATQLAAG